MVKIVGMIRLDNTSIPVYESLDESLFRVDDILKIIDVPKEKILDVIALCEGDEIFMLPRDDDDPYSDAYATEAGLYDILSQARNPTARKWRRVIIKELIKLRRSRGYNIIDQFDEWGHELDSLYFDEETGVLMESITVPGGDVIQVPYKPNNDELTED